MDESISRLVYELAAEIFKKEVGKSKADRSAYALEHTAEWSIQTARAFVEVAKKRGLIKEERGLFNAD